MVKAKLKPFEEKISKGEGFAILSLPIKTVSEANNFDHWTKKHKRHKEQKLAIFWICRTNIDHIKLPCTIKLTRLAPRMIDAADNLPMSFKYILDAICEILTGQTVAGRADSHPGISVSYDQIKTSNCGIMIEIISLCQ